MITTSENETYRILPIKDIFSNEVFITTDPRTGDVVIPGLAPIDLVIHLALDRQTGALTVTNAGRKTFEVVSQGEEPRTLWYGASSIFQPGHTFQMLISVRLPTKATASLLTIDISFDDQQASLCYTITETK